MKNTPPATPRRKVLVVDDHPIVSRGISLLLGQTDDLECPWEARDADSALAILREHTVDLAVVDVSLPGVSGIELTRRLLQHSPDLPVLMLSMHSESLYAERALVAGARGFLMKQAATEQLVEAIRKLLAGGIYVSPAVERRLHRLLTAEAAPAAPPPEDAPIRGLNPREYEVLQMIAQGYTSAEIATRLNRSVKSVELYRASLRGKLGVASPAELVRRAVELFGTRAA